MHIISLYFDENVTSYHAGQGREEPTLVLLLLVFVLPEGWGETQEGKDMMDMKEEVMEK